MAKANITIEGYVAKDPESRAAGNHTITSVTIPVEQGRMKDGQWVVDTDQQGNKIVVWWVAEFWNEHGDVVASQVRKGSLVTVTGEARPSVYVSKQDGSPRLSALVVNGQLAVVVPRPKRGGGQGASSAPFTGGSSSGDGWAAPGASQSFDNEAPF